MDKKDKANQSLNQRNFQALAENDKILDAKIQEIADSMKVLEAALANLQADVANSKQLMGHLMGRGMGSTVHTG